MTIGDQQQDTDLREWGYYRQLYPFPDFVKTAMSEDSGKLCGAEAYSNLNDSLFADPVHRQFPVDTAVSTCLSWVHFLEKRADLPAKTAAWTEQRLVEFSAYHEIEREVRTLREKHSELRRDCTDQLPDSCFALITATDAGTKERQCPLRNAIETRKAAEWLVSYRDHFAYPVRQEMADKILDKAAEYGAALSEDVDGILERIAGRGVYDPKELAGAIRWRTKLAQMRMTGEVREGMEKLAEQVESNPYLATDPASSRQLCATIEQFDRTTNLFGKYGADLPRPEDVVFAGSLKQAAAFVKDAVELVNGSIYERPQLGRLSMGTIRDAFGSKIANSVADGLDLNVEKMAILAMTLPRPDAELLDRMMEEAGQRPFAKQARVSPSNLSDGDYRQLAMIADILGDGVT